MWHTDFEMNIGKTSLLLLVILKSALVYAHSDTTERYPSYRAYSLRLGTLKYNNNQFSTLSYDTQQQVGLSIELACQQNKYISVRTLIDFDFGVFRPPFLGSPIPDIFSSASLSSGVYYNLLEWHNFKVKVGILGDIYYNAVSMAQFSLSASTNNAAAYRIGITFTPSIISSYTLPIPKYPITLQLSVDMVALGTVFANEYGQMLVTPGNFNLAGKFRFVSFHNYTRMATAISANFPIGKRYAVQVGYRYYLSDESVTGNIITYNQHQCTLGLAFDVYSYFYNRRNSSQHPTFY